MTDPGFVSSSNKTVLVVDDDASIRELLEFLIKKEGFKVESARDGEEALRKSRQLSPDIILLDLMLPKLGGFEILRELQSDATAGIPIVIITGRFTDRSTSDMMRQEPNVIEFMEKPLKTQVLIATLHKILKTQPPLKRRSI